MTVYIQQKKIVDILQQCFKSCCKDKMVTNINKIVIRKNSVHSTDAFLLCVYETTCFDSLLQSANLKQINLLYTHVDYILQKLRAYTKNTPVEISLHLEHLQFKIGGDIYHIPVDKNITADISSITKPHKLYKTYRKCVKDIRTELHNSKERKEEVYHISDTFVIHIPLIYTILRKCEQIDISISIFHFNDAMLVQFQMKHYRFFVMATKEGK